MSEVSDSSGKGWFQSLPGILTTIAATITALAAVVGAVPGLWDAIRGASPAHTDVQNCAPGYVWREAIPDDHVCVSLEAHLRTAQDNLLAGSRRDPRGGEYGADQCLSGFVWREAFVDDRVCVLPGTRDLVELENKEGALHLKP
ncbi:MAG TPA: hypothetical protein VEU06_00405 [Micropepsaceae bacterium]|nr:hypothetical protein [Micropepsaceae bacterium]